MPSLGLLSSELAITTAIESGVYKVYLDRPYLSGALSLQGRLLTPKMPRLTGLNIGQRSRRESRKYPTNLGNGGPHPTPKTQ